MTFLPQYSTWAKDDFSSSDGAIYTNTGEYEIVDGVAKLLPAYFSGQTYSFDAPWPPVTTWDVNNTLDSIPIVTGNFSIVTATGYQSTSLGIYGNTGDTSQTAFFTSTTTPVTGANGNWVSGNHSCFVYNASSKTTLQYGKMTIELSVRSLPEGVTHQLGPESLSGVTCHGIYFGNTVNWGFIEVHPSGLKVHGTTGAILPGDYSSRMRRIRLVKEVNSYTIQADDNTSLYVPSGQSALPFTQSCRYIAFGAPPFFSGANFTGTNGFFQSNTGTPFFYDSKGLTGIAGYEGTVLWDDVKITFGLSAVSYPSGYAVTYPSGSKSIYTAPWYPSHSISNYVGAVVKANQYNGGSTTVAVQYATPSGSFGSTAWQDSAAPVLTFNGTQSPTSYIDLSSIPVFNGIPNAIRFKLTANSLSGNVPEIDDITTIAKSSYTLVDITPNWKMSSLPKDIFFAIDKDKHQALIPPPHYQDEIYLHNELSIPRVAVGSYVPAPETNLFPGLVSSSYTGQGLVRIEDGFYGNAWRNFNIQDSYSGVWSTNASSPLMTGNLLATGNIFYGELLSTYSPYPASPPTAATGIAAVQYIVEPYVTPDNSTIFAQRVVVDSWYSSSSTQDIGICMTGIKPPTGQLKIGVIQGVIQIPRGPGVMVTLKDTSTSTRYYLDGYQYRQPKPFSCAVTYTGDRSDTTISFGSVPRLTKPSGLILNRWGSWKEKLLNEDVDEFILYSVTGSIVDHNFVQYTSTGAISRNSSPLRDYDVYDTVPYSPVSRSSVLFEGWIRPHGFVSTITGFEVELLKSVSSDGRGLFLYLNRSGEPRATIDLNVHSSAMGITGDSWQVAGPRTNGSVITGRSGQVSVTSESNTLSFGNWNHIGVYQDTRAIGDIQTASDQPLVAAGDKIYHGARTSRLVLEINGRPVNSVGLAIDPYGETGFLAGSVAASYPASTTYVNTWPKIPSYALTGTSRQTTIGQYVLCDMDHLRFGIRDRVDARASCSVFGAKTSPPTFTPWNSIKPPIPSTGDYNHLQWSHIYRLDAQEDAFEWDEGFGITHLKIPNNASVTQELSSRGIKTHQLFVEKIIGPKGRYARRLGPSANLVIPFSAYDERIFNGTGSASMTQAGVANAGDRYYSNNSAFAHANLDKWASGLSGYQRTNSNSRFVAGGFFKIFNLPTGALEVADLVSYEEVNGINSYALASAYIGINSGAQLVYGTRRTREGIGTTSQYVVGPFTGGIVPTGSWCHIGIDANLGLGSGYLKSYISGDLDSNTPVYLTETGWLSSTTGRCVGYQGLLGSSLNNVTNRSNFIFGGEHPRDASISAAQSFRYFDVGVSELFVGFPFSGYIWPWKQLAHTGASGFSGLSDVAVKNTDTIIDYIVGTGTPTQQPYYGIAHYPATPFTGAGEHLLWCTSNMGNDYEGLNKAGLALFDESVFINAESYYAMYENDSATQSFGSTDSPIQIGSNVPPEGVNLALINNKEWTSDSSTVAFDLSDKNYANITNKFYGDFTARTFIYNPSGQGIRATGQFDSTDIRLSSFPVWNDNANSYVGYFMHLIGGESKGIYVPNALPHSQVTGDYDQYHNNLTKIDKAIVIKDAQGNNLTYDEFPYRIVSFPYNPSIPLTGVSNYYGFNTVINSGLVNTDRVYTSILISPYQTIGKTVFINYPSLSYDNSVVNLQDTEIYNPIPLMKQVSYDDVYPDGKFSGQSGWYSMNLNATLRSYDINIWHGDTTGWTGSV